MRRLAAIALLGLPACLLLTTPEQPWACETDADCHDGLRCRTLFRIARPTCVASDECGLDQDCRDHGALAWCQGGTCRQPECSADRECVPYRCVDHRLCGGYCYQSADCSPGAACVDKVCVRIPCKDPGPCEGGRCRDGYCATDCDVVGCESGFACYSGRCRCTADSTVCGVYACDKYTGKCQTSCAYGSDCAPGFSCVSGRCVRCSGTPLPCEKQTSCGLPGCTSVDRCGAGTLDCTKFNLYWCENVVGCWWADGCNGTAQCADQKASMCELLACKTTKGCTGTPLVKCREQSAVECSTIAGCANDATP